MTLCQGICGDPRGVGVSDERGTPAREKAVFIQHWAQLRGARVQSTETDEGIGSRTNQGVMASGSEQGEG